MQEFQLKTKNSIYEVQIHSAGVRMRRAAKADGTPVAATDILSHWIEGDRLEIADRGIMLFLQSVLLCRTSPLVTE